MFGIKKGGKQEVSVYKLADASSNVYKTKFKQIGNKLCQALKKKTNQRFLIICLFAMHGLIKGGS